MMKPSADPGPHRVWVTDSFLLGRSALMDGDTGTFLGMLSAGKGHIVPVFAPDGDEIYLVETHFARTWRGERTDVVAVYDGRTLGDRGEIAIPPKRANYPPHAAGSVALSDDGRFLAVFNLTPATSVSLVDVRARSFLREVATPGCSLVYP
ncbi:MAG: amine dehydrogenase large subunit, partial [Myxococcota bacterium]